MEKAGSAKSTENQERKNTLEKSVSIGSSQFVQTLGKGQPSLNQIIKKNLEIKWEITYVTASVEGLASAGEDMAEAGNMTLGELVDSLNDEDEGRGLASPSCLAGVG